MRQRHEAEWTRQELAFIDANLGMTLKELCAALDRDPVPVSRAKARIEHPTLSDPWTVEDDQFVLSTPHLTAAQVGRHLGRSTHSVTARRAILAEVKGVRFGKPGDVKNPSHIGARPLIAKTCIKCGKLLAAEWFSYSPTQNGKGGWRTRCRKCLSGDNREQGKGSNKYHGSARYREKTRESRKRLQDLTVPRATRGGDPWLEADHTVLRDPDLTLFEKALELKRSYNAVSIICSTHGYRSHVGLGKQTDLWRIFNPNELADLTSA